MEHIAPRFLNCVLKFRSSILICLATASLDLEPDLISMQNILLFPVWHNCIRRWHNCFRRDLTFFRVDRHMYFICEITWKLIQKCYKTEWRISVWTWLWQFILWTLYNLNLNAYIMILTVWIVATCKKTLRQKQPNPLMSQVLSLKRAFGKVKWVNSVRL